MNKNEKEILITAIMIISIILGIILFLFVLPVMIYFLSEWWHYWKV